jgi:hypothetical protein
MMREKYGPAQVDKQTRKKVAVHMFGWEYLDSPVGLNLAIWPPEGHEANEDQWGAEWWNGIPHWYSDFIYFNRIIEKFIQDGYRVEYTKCPDGIQAVAMKVWGGPGRSMDGKTKAVGDTAIEAVYELAVNVYANG